MLSVVRSFPWVKNALLRRKWEIKVPAAAIRKSKEKAAWIENNSSAGLLIFGKKVEEDAIKPREGGRIDDFKTFKVTFKTSLRALSSEILRFSSIPKV
jgi:hypothetical protein